jgi:hypothetical protein
MLSSMRADTKYSDYAWNCLRFNFINPGNSRRHNQCSLSHHPPFFKFKILIKSGFLHGCLIALLAHHEEELFLAYKAVASGR